MKKVKATLAWSALLGGIGFASFGIRYWWFAGIAIACVGFHFAVVKPWEKAFESTPAKAEIEEILKREAL